MKVNIQPIVISKVSQEDSESFANTGETISWKLERVKRQKI